MIVTRIERQQKRPDRYSVYIDGVFSFGLSENDLLRLGLYKGQELTSEKVDQLKAEAETGKLYERTLSYLAIRPRSEKEIRDYLRRKEADRVTTRAIITKLKNQHLLDDVQFARAWVEWRQATTPRSKRKLTAELRQKGIASEAIEAALSDIDSETELALVRELIDKRGHRYASDEKLMAYLARQGYRYDVIKQALSDE